MNNLVKKFIAVLIVVGLNLPTASIALAQSNFTPSSVNPSGFKPTAANLKADLAGTEDLCKLDFLNKGVTKLKGLLKKKDEVAEISPEINEIGEVATEASELETHVWVTNDDFAFLPKIDASTKQSAKDTARLRSKAFCLDGLATILIRTMLQHVTNSIVDWINNGFEGDNGERAPLFVSDTRSFFNTIAQAEINAFGLELNNSKNPYARGFMTSLAQALQNRFEDNARYSFNELMSGGISGAGLGITIADFQRDFTLGGWEAWLALTQVPYNNPIGAEIEFSRELGTRLRGLYQNNLEQARAELTVTGGFLGDERCIDKGKKKVTRRQDMQARARDPEEYAKKPLCPSGQFQYVTPGQFIASQANLANSSVLRQFEMADSLTDALAAISDALINQLTKTMTEGFFEPIEINTSGFQLGISQPEGNQYIPPLYQNSDWFLAHPDFDITKGISQAIIDEQRTMKSKLEEQNKELLDLIKWIRQLDYCVPGPSSDWETRANELLSQEIELIPPFDTWLGKKEKTLDQIVGSMALAGAGIGALVGSLTVVLIPVGAAVGAIIGAVAGFLVNIFGNQINDKDMANIVAVFLGALYDIHFMPSVELISGGAVVSVLSDTLESYREIIEKTYFDPADPLNIMPTVTPEARTALAEIIGYDQMMNKNLERISITTNVINNLTDLKEKLDLLVPKYNPADPAVVQQFKDFGALFARLTNNMASGDDIAEVDDLLKQIKDKRDYVKDTLVGSCESEIAKLSADNPAVYKTYVGRRPYPIGQIDHPYADPPGRDLGFLYYNTFHSSWGPSSGVTTGKCTPPLSGLPAVHTTFDNTLRLDIDHSGTDCSASLWKKDFCPLPSGAPGPNNCGSVSRRFEGLMGMY
ncbi:MAG TPA: hypothetical protein VJ103_02905 [Candidatus Paceibacterota bacterium]|nr:hypothetical protein [Candidatus Paceibacterota bacterium]